MRLDPFLIRETAKSEKSNLIPSWSGKTFHLLVTSCCRIKTHSSVSFHVYQAYNIIFWSILLWSLSSSEISCCKYECHLKSSKPNSERFDIAENLCCGNTLPLLSRLEKMMTQIPVLIFVQVSHRLLLLVTRVVQKVISFFVIIRFIAQSSYLYTYHLHKIKTEICVIFF